MTLHRIMPRQGKIKPHRVNQLGQLGRRRAELRYLKSLEEKNHVKFFDRWTVGAGIIGTALVVTGGVMSSLWATR